MIFYVNNSPEWCTDYLVLGCLPVTLSVEKLMDPWS